MWASLVVYTIYKEIERIKTSGETVQGGMAEWTIAAVLKTAEPKAPGVRIPLPPLTMKIYTMK
jgi:hypothetical protein